MRNGNSTNAPSFMSDELKTGSAIDRMAANDDYYSGKNDEEYVVEGSIIGCTYGFRPTKIGTLKDHGVYDKNGNAVLLDSDCVSQENIYSFGLCGSPVIREKNVPTIKLQPGAPYANGVTIPGYKCMLELVPKWQGGDAHLHVVNGNQCEQALLSNAVLTCTYGEGVITVKEVNKTANTPNKVTVNLSQLLNSTVAWNFRDVKSYNLTTSIPTYKNGTVGRNITQEDVDEINRIMDLYEINLGLERVRHFLAQCHAETDAGFKPIEQFDRDPLTDQRFQDYEKKGNSLGNIPGSGDGHKFRGGGAIQLTGRTEYRIFSEYMGDPKILSDGALYVGQKCFWEAAGFFWSVFKPNSASMAEENMKGNQLTIYKSQKGGGNKFDLNGKCDGGATVKEITDIVYGNGNNPGANLQKRIDAYNYYKTAIK